MGSSSKSNPLNMLQLDIQYRDRQLAAELAMHNAEIAFQQSQLQLVSIPALEQDKFQFSQNYALEQAKLTFQQEMAKLEYGESQRQFDVTNELEQRKFVLQQNMQEFTQRIQQGQFELDKASITGFYEGQPTMQRINMEAGLTGYYNGAPTFAREQFEKNFGLEQAQTVLNAPRGPADYAAYLNRLYGLQQQGFALPGAVNNILTGQQTGSAGAMQGPMPTSNTAFANALVYGQQAPTTPLGTGTAAAPAQGTPAQPNTEATTGGSSLFSSAAGGSGQYDQLSGGLQSGDQIVKSGSDVNFRDWQKLSPVTQQYVQGYAEEALGQPKEDFMWGIANSAPALPQSQTQKQGIF